jgi:hypothetical protein
MKVLTTECRRSYENIGDMGGVLCRDVGNQGCRGREWEGGTIASEIRYEIVLWNATVW